MPPRPRKAIRELAAAIADGEAIDWGRASHDLGDQEPSGVLPVLRFAAERAHEALQPQGLATEVLRLESRTLVRAVVGLLLVYTALQATLSCVVVFFGSALQNRVPSEPVLAFILAFLGSAFVLVRREHFDSRVLWLAGFFLAAASSACQVFLAHLPDLLGDAIWVRAWTAILPECFLPAFLWGFLREFPRVRHFDRTAKANTIGFRTSVLIGGILFAVNLALTLGRAAAPAAWHRSLAPLHRDHASETFWLTLSVLLICAPVVALFKRDLADSVEVRRVRWFLGAVAVGVLPMFASVVADAAWPAFSQATDTPRGIFWSAWILYGFLMIVPIATAYAVLSQRALDLRTALHGAARLALARTTLAALALLPPLLLARFIVRHSGESLGALARHPAIPPLLVLSVLGLALLSVRSRLLRFAERRWVGHRSGLREAMGTFSGELLAARDLRSLDRAIETSAATLIGAERASILLSSPSTGLFTAIRHAHRDLSGSTALVQVVAAAGRPVQTSPDSSDSIFRVLPGADRQWLAESGAAVVTSLTDSVGLIRGLLLIGPNRSGASYVPEEADLAGVLASTAAIALERFDWGASLAPQSGEATQPAGHCLHCGRVFPGSTGACDCGRGLEPAPVPFELAGKFRLKSVLGRGGMGIVFLATDLELSRHVALKTLPKLGSSALLRLRREARSMASVSHPNLATIFGLESFNGLPVLVMEYLQGGTLAEKLASPMAVNGALRIATEIAAGLAELHARGLLHRDIKPSNIAFGAGGVAKLLDFGLAKITDAAAEGGDSLALARVRGTEQAITPASHAVGTLVFLSPEALRGEPASEAQDLWAFHLVLWEMIAGRHPCQDLPQNQAFRLLSQGEIPDVRELQPDCPGPLADLLGRGLAKEQAARASSAEKIHKALLEIARVL